MQDVADQLVQMLPRLRRFARGLSGSVAAADDLVQGACERALRAADTWQPGTRFDSWMYRIVRNLWIDDRRRARPEVPDDEAYGLAGEDGRRIAEARLELADVREHVARLPDSQREVLMLVCVEDLSYREAAEIMEIPVGTVMSRLARARAALAEAVAGGEDRRVRGVS